jgi:hypothetical protein
MRFYPEALRQDQSRPLTNQSDIEDLNGTVAMASGYGLNGGTYLKLVVCFTDTA